MTNVVLLGGNGYIGRNMTSKWMAKDPTAHFYVVSRSGKNQLTAPQISNLKADVTDINSVIKVLPDQVDYIVDLIGAPAKDPVKFKQINDLPAQVMLEIAKKYHVKAMGFIGGILGDKQFVQGKKRLTKMLKNSGIRTEVVAPTLVYGNGRQDSMTKMVPFLKFLGIFSKRFKPMDVNDVANELVNKMTDD